MPATSSRTVGSGFTTFQFQGQPIAFFDELHDSGQPPIRQYEAVTPLGDSFPREFALPRVKAEGQLQLIMRELWNQPAWWALAGFANTYNIIDIYNYQSQNNVNPITCTTIIQNPYGAHRGWTYVNTQVISIDDREVVQIGALTMPRTIGLIYATKNYFPSPSYSGPGGNGPAGNQ